MSFHRIALLPVALLVPACALDVPDAEPTFDQGRPTVTLYQVQDPDAEGHPEPGTNVRVTNLLVTAVDRFDEDGGGHTGTVFVQERDGGPFSGIQMFRPTIQPANEYLLPGDVVEVEGEYVEFELGQINPEWADTAERTVSQISQGIIRKTGEWISPEPTVVEDAMQVQVDPEAEGWEGVLVEIGGVEALSRPGSRGDFFVSTGDECVAAEEGATCPQVDDDNYSIPDVVEGTRIDRVAGVVTYLYTYKILPRSSLDAEVDAPAQN